MVALPTIEEYELSLKIEIIFHKCERDDRKSLSPFKFNKLARLKRNTLSWLNIICYHNYHLLRNFSVWQNLAENYISCISSQVGLCMKCCFKIKGICERFVKY